MSKYCHLSPSYLITGRDIIRFIKEIINIILDMSILKIRAMITVSKINHENMHRVYK
jgi:hypothetical protein